MQEFGNQFPGIVRPLITERDEYLSHMLYYQAQFMSSGSVMVAVVGAGHVSGIVENWGKSIDVVELEKVCVCFVAHSSFLSTLCVQGGLYDG